MPRNLRFCGLRLLILALALAAGCSGNTINCGGPVSWNELEGEIVEVGVVSSASPGQQNAEVRVQTSPGEVQKIKLWGRPEEVAVGSTYHFVVTQDGEAFLDYTGDTRCLDGPRNSFRIE